MRFNRCEGDLNLESTLSIICRLQQSWTDTPAGLLGFRFLNLAVTTRK